MARLTAVVLFGGLAIAAPPSLGAMAQFEVSQIQGIFINPVGGMNSGVGTNLFFTGDASGDPSWSQSVFNFAGMDAIGGRPIVASLGQSFPIGVLIIRNGTNLLGSAATEITLSQRILVTPLNPVQPHSAFFLATADPISILNTPNTADPVESADRYRSSNWANQLAVLENGLASAEIRARIDQFPVDHPTLLGGDPQIEYEYRLVVEGFSRVLEGDGFIEPAPEPSTELLMLVATGLTSLAPIGRVVRGMRRTMLAVG